MKYLSDILEAIWAIFMALFKIYLAITLLLPIVIVQILWILVKRAFYAIEAWLTPGKHVDIPDYGRNTQYDRPPTKWKYTDY